MCRSHGWSMGCRWAEWNACLSYMSLHWAAQQMGQSDGCDYIYKWGIYSIILLSVSVCYRSCHRHRQRQTQPDRFAKTFSSFSSEIFVDASTVDSSMPMKIYCREWQGNVHVFIAILCGDRRPMTEGEKRTCCAQHWRVWEHNSPRLCISNKVHLSRLCIWRERKLRHRIIVNFPFKFYLANALVLFFYFHSLCAADVYTFGFVFFVLEKFEIASSFAFFWKWNCLFFFLSSYAQRVCFEIANIGYIDIMWTGKTIQLFDASHAGRIVKHAFCCNWRRCKNMQTNAGCGWVWQEQHFPASLALQQWNGIRMIFRRCVLCVVNAATSGDCYSIDDPQTSRHFLHSNTHSDCWFSTQ